MKIRSGGNFVCCAWLCTVLVLIALSGLLYALVNPLGHRAPNSVSIANGTINDMTGTPKGGTTAPTPANTTTTADDTTEGEPAADGTTDAATTTDGASSTLVKKKKTKKLANTSIAKL